MRFRRNSLRFLAVLLVGGATACGGPGSGRADGPRAESEEPSADPEAVLSELREGNRRFVEAHALHPHAEISHALTLSSAQHPKAIVLGCSDSRCPPELLLDQGIGDLFVVRVAGNVLDPTVVASVEYAVEHLHVPLVLVLGHTHCGAVTAAVRAHGDLEAHLALGPNLGHLVERIEPALAAIPEGKEDDKVSAAVVANVRQVVGELGRYSPVLHEAQERKKLKIVAAVHDVAGGAPFALVELPARPH